MVDGRQLTRYADPAEFLRAVALFLEERESANTLLLGLLMQVAGRLEPVEAFMVQVADPAGTGLVAFKEKKNLVLAGTEPEVSPLVVEALVDGGWTLPGVVGPPEMAEEFARFWAEATGCSLGPAMEQRIYELREVIWPLGVPGRMRAGAADDMELLVEWTLAFCREASADLMTADEARTLLEDKIRDQRVFLWDDGGEPVATTSLSRPTRRTLTINAVYTPPERRNRGYASALVAGVSGRVLALGKEAAVLYTDLSNPTSNSIYQKIGYLPVCDSRHVPFRQP